MYYDNVITLTRCLVCLHRRGLVFPKHDCLWFSFVCIFVMITYFLSAGLIIGGFMIYGLRLDCFYMCLKLPKVELAVPTASTASLRGSCGGWPAGIKGQRPFEAEKLYILINLLTMARKEKKLPQKNQPVSPTDVIAS